MKNLAGSYTEAIENIRGEKVESGVIQETGQPVKYFDTVDEMLYRFSEGKIHDGEAVAFPESSGLDPTKRYGFPLASTTTNEINVVYPTHYYNLGLVPISWHDLPDPGWIMDVEHQMIISPEGEKFPINIGPIVAAFIEAVIACLPLILKVVAVIVSLAIIYAIVYQITYMRVSQATQISSTLVSVTAPSGEAFIYDKNTGEEKGHVPPPSNNWTWIIILAGGLIALYFLAPYLGKLGGGSEEGGEWAGRVYEPEERWGRPEPEERPTTRGYLFGRRVGKALRRAGRGAKETGRGIWHGIKGE